jgi:phage shock protein A
MTAKVNLQAAASEIGNMVRAFRAFSEAQNVLDVLANHEQVARESKAAAEVARTDLDKATGDLEKAKADAVDIRKKAKDAVTAAESKAATMLADATEKAEGMVAAAQMRVSDLTDEVAMLGDQAKALRNTVAEETGRLEALQQRLNLAQEARRKALEEA